MKNNIFIPLILFTFIFSNSLFSQNIDSLRFKINEIISSKNATVGVAICGNNGKDTISFNGNYHFPLQSVFKFHIGLVMLSQIDKGKFSLNQKIKIKKDELMPDFYSPIREKYPNGGSLPLSEIINYTVSSSDNVGCDLMLRLLGGPLVVEKYFLDYNIKNLSIKLSEGQQQKAWDLQFQNWITPKAANETLIKFFDKNSNLLSKSSYDFIWNAMRNCTTGVSRLKGQLPQGTIVAHKTGTSDTNEQGITAAVNDIGIVFLPDGRYFIISVLITNSKENFETNEKIIAEIAKATWNFYSGEKP